MYISYKYIYITRLLSVLQCVAVRRRLLQTVAVWYVWYRGFKCKENILQHTATHCNTLQHTATPCNTLQHTHCSHCNTLFLMGTVAL